MAAAGTPPGALLDEPTRTHLASLYSLLSIGRGTTESETCLLAIDRAFTHARADCAAIIRPDGAAGLIVAAQRGFRLPLEVRSDEGIVGRALGRGGGAGRSGARRPRRAPRAPRPDGGPGHSGARSHEATARRVPRGAPAAGPVRARHDRRAGLRGGPPRREPPASARWTARGGGARGLLREPRSIPNRGGCGQRGNGPARADAAILRPDGNRFVCRRRRTAGRRDGAERVANDRAVVETREPFVPPRMSVGSGARPVPGRTPRAAAARWTIG
jgi:hypothetical protein